MFWLIVIGGGSGIMNNEYGLKNEMNKEYLGFTFSE